MFFTAVKQLKTAIILLILMCILTGIIYPAIITGIGQIIFPWKVNGSLIEKNGKLLGSELIGQSFTSNQYFWSRPSATTPYPYNAESSSGSNLDPINDTLLTQVRVRATSLKEADFSNDMAVPVDTVTASGSGLDPEISPYAAQYQAHRVALARGLPTSEVEKKIKQFTQARFLGVLGEPRVNVLRLNLALDELQGIANIPKD